MVEAVAEETAKPKRPAKGDFMAFQQGCLKRKKPIGYYMGSFSEDEKLTGIIARGMKRIDEIAGESLGLHDEDAPRALLMAYCMYDRANALDDFEKNYLSELLDLQNQKEG